MPESPNVYDQLYWAVSERFWGAQDECEECGRGPMPYEHDSACPVGKTLAWIEKERAKYELV